MKRNSTLLFVSFLLAMINPLSVHADFSEPHWELGINDWGIVGKAVPPPSEMLDIDKEKLRSELKNTELYTAESMLQKSTWGGGCQGSAVSSILSAYGLIDYSLYTHENGTVPRGLTDIGYPYLSDTGMIEDVNVPRAAGSLIQYYHCLQCADVMRQESAWLRYSTTPKERVDMLIEKLENGKPVLVGTWTGDVKEGQVGHAVVAYGIEPCDVDRNDTHYDKYVLTYDPNFPRKCETHWSTEWLDLNASLYLNSETGDWCLQWLGGSYVNGYLDCIIDDVNLLNAHGLLEGTDPYVTDKPFLGVMTSNWIGQTHKLQTIAVQDGNVKVLGDASYMETPAFYPDYNENAILNYLIEDTNSGYRMLLDESQALETVMFYENSIAKAQAKRAKETTVTPNGYVAFKGEYAPYELEYCLNEGYYTGAWYQLSAQGNASDAALQLTDDGWVLTSDSLYHVHIKTKSKSQSEQYRLFSTDASSVLFSSTDADAVIASVDTNGDGIFETELSDISNQLGDIDGNGIVNALDAADILISAAKLGAGEETGLNELQTLIADVDDNGQINAADASQILIYAAEVGAGNYSESIYRFMDIMVS